MPTSALKALSSISQIDLTQSLKQILEEILIIAGEEMGAHSGSFILINEETGEIELVATFGLPDDYIERVYSKGVQITNSPAGEVLEAGKYYVVPNIFDEPGDKPWADFARELGISAQMFMPMKRRDEVIGLLNIYMADPHEFTEDEIAVGTVAASHAAAVIESIRLYTQLSDKKENLEREVTGHKRVEDLLWASREILSNILSASPIGIGIVKDRKLSWTNERMMELFGFTIDEYDFIGKSAEVIYASKDEYERVGRIFYNELKESELVEVDAKLKRRDGSIFDGHIKMSFLDHSNPAKGAVATISDISWRKQAEEALQESEERFRSLFDNLSVGIAMIDRGGQVLAANKTACRFLDYPQEELIGMPLTKLIYPGDLDADRDLFKPIINGENDHCLMDKRYVRKDGEIVWGRLHVSGIKDEEGHIKYMSVICEDITACKLVEKALLIKDSEMASAFAKCKHMKEALKRSEQNYKEIAEFLPDLIYKTIFLDA